MDDAPGPDVEARAPRARRRRRWLVRLAVVAGTLLCIEVGMRAVLALRGEAYDSGTTWSRLRAHLDEIQGIEFEGGAEDRDRPRAPGVVPHPYFGWQGLRARQRTTEHLRSRSGAPENAYDVWVVGGSVARAFGGADVAGRPSGAGAEELEALLEAEPRLAGRDVRVFNYAWQAFKQPQQLTKVAYLLTLGLRPDAVVNLDGFNEVAIGNQNASHGAHPVYPSIPQWGGAVLPLEVVEHDEILALRRRATWLGETVLATRIHHSCVVGWLADRVVLQWRWEYRRLNSTYAERLLRRAGDDVLRGPAEGLVEDGVWDAIVEIWLESSRSLHALCRERGALYLHVLQPTLHDEGSKPLTDEELANAGVDARWIEGVETGYPLLKAASARLVEAGVAFVDATDAFAGVEETLYTDYCHFGDEGNVLLARRIAPDLIAHLPER